MMPGSNPYNRNNQRFTVITHYYCTIKDNVTGEELGEYKNKDDAITECWKLNGENDEREIAANAASRSG